jgi:transposase
MFYLGIDVAKAKLDCCLIDEKTTDKRKTKVVANSVAGVLDLIRWLDKQSASLESTHALLEGTGVYHEIPAMALHEAGLKVSILNPAQVRKFAEGLAVRTKTDRMDSAVLARYGVLVKPDLWHPPPPSVRELKALMARRDALMGDLQLVGWDGASRNPSILDFGLKLGFHCLPSPPTILSFP